MSKCLRCSTTLTPIQTPLFELLVLATFLLSFSFFGWVWLCVRVLFLSLWFMLLSTSDFLCACQIIKKNTFSNSRRWFYSSFIWQFVANATCKSLAVCLMHLGNKSACWRASVGKFHDPLFLLGLSPFSKVNSEKQQQVINRFVNIENLFMPFVSATQCLQNCLYRYRSEFLILSQFDF